MGRENVGREDVFLRDREQGLRQSLAEKPGDLTAHTDLAACLLLKAVYRAGQDSVSTASTPATTDALDPTRPSPEVATLLRECLLHLQAVRDVSPDPVPWIQNDQLFMLLQWFARDSNLVDITEEATRSLAELTEAVMAGEE